MPKTVEQEMPTEQRARELLMGLKSTAKDKVFVNISHLAQVVGMEEADNLAESLAGTTEIPFFRVRSRSTLRVNATRSGMAQIDRVAAIEAIEKTVESGARKEIDKAIRSQSSMFWQPTLPTQKDDEQSEDKTEDELVNEGKVEPDVPPAAMKSRQVERPAKVSAQDEALKRKAEELKKASE